MPVSIPFDPALVLGEIVPPKRMEHLKNTAAAVQPAADAQDDLNALILARRSLDMTIQELINLQVAPDQISAVTEKRGVLNGQIANKASELAQARIDSVDAVRTLREALDGDTGSQINVSVESPLDLNKSILTTMPLSSDSLKLDAQYFRYESNTEDSEAHANAIGIYVSGQVQSLFGEKSAEVGANAKEATLGQHANHDIEGTLVITATCTHKQADVFAPLVLDPEKAIRAWNVYVPDAKIDMDDPASAKAAGEGPTAGDAKMFVLSGTTRGSSFVGMVHIIKSEKTDSSQSSAAVSAKVETAMETGAFIASKSGKFGVEASFSDNVKNLLSTSNLQSHASVITMGIIPTLKSSKIETVVQSLKPQPKEIMGQLAAIQGATDTGINTVSADAAKATDGESFMELNNSYLTSVVSELGKLEASENQVIDTNSMMTAFDDYVAKAAAGDCGVPINFYLAPITARQVATSYLRKFYPHLAPKAIEGAEG